MLLKQCLSIVSGDERVGQMSQCSKDLLRLFPTLQGTPSRIVVVNSGLQFFFIMIAMYDEFHLV